MASRGSTPTERPAATCPTRMPWLGKRPATSGSNPARRHSRGTSSPRYVPGRSRAHRSFASSARVRAGARARRWPGGRTSSSGSVARSTVRMPGTGGSSPVSTVTAMSQDPVSRAGMLSCGSTSSSSRSRRGWVSASEVAATTRRGSTPLAKEDTRSRPTGCERSSASSPSMASSRSSTSRARSASSAPAGVSTSRLPTRSSRRVRVSVSRAASCCETLDGLMLSSAATARTVPSRPKASSSCSRHGFRGITPA